MGTNQNCILTLFKSGVRKSKLIALTLCIMFSLPLGKGWGWASFAQPTWVVSAAALGDTSVYIYPVSWGADTILTLRHPSNQDSLKVSTITGTPNGIHIYRVNAAPSITTGITNIGSNNRYFGVFTANGTNPTYTATYYYTGNPLCCPTPNNKLRLFKRSDNAATSWTDALATQDSTANTLTKASESPRGEYILGLGDPPPPPTCVHPTTTCNALVQNGWGPLWVMSAAPLGDSSTYIYPASWTGTIVVLQHLCGQDSLGVSSVTGTPNGIHIYRVDTTPCITTGITGLGSNNRYFGVFAANGTIPTYTATYYYAGNPLVNAGNENNLLLFKRSDNAATPWTDATATLNTTNHTLIKTNESARGEYILGLSSGQLPVELLKFTAVLMNNKYVLTQWVTATEINSDYFTVEKTKDDMQYEFVGQLKGAGNSTGTFSYQLIDTSPEQGTSYYRLKQTDFDGKYTYSDLVPVNLNGVALISISPNPAIDNFEYKIGSTEKMNLQVKVVDILGQIVINKTETVEKGITQKRLDVSALSSGPYILELITENKEVRGKQFQIK